MCTHSDDIEGTKSDGLEVTAPDGEETCVAIANKRTGAGRPKIGVEDLGHENCFDTMKT
jgi:hypothetical protein